MYIYYDYEHLFNYKIQGTNYNANNHRSKCVGNEMTTRRVVRTITRSFSKIILELLITHLYILFRS